jgi:hypothetical protein
VAITNDNEVQVYTSFVLFLFAEIIFIVTYLVLFYLNRFGIWNFGSCSVLPSGKQN